MSKPESERDRLLMELAARVADGQEVEWDDPRLVAAGLDHTVDAFRAVSELSSLFGAAQEERSGGAGATGQPAIRWGPLEVHEELGRGGFGVVYRAREPALERDVALKLARRDRAGEIAAARFAEARRLARVRHPNVLTVYGVAEHDGRTGLWSELIDGVTLEALLDLP